MKHRKLLGKGISLLALMAAWPQVHAQQLASPSLTARIDGIEDDTRKQPQLKIANLDISVQLDGLLADITLTADFSNPSDEDVEGEFALALPFGAIVTGYGLDIDGVMVDGVLASQGRAKAAYEDRLREGIDPGLAEITKDNRFKTRIFPVRAGKGRTIRVSMAVPVGADGRFALPLLSAERVGKLSIRLGADGLAGAPAMMLPGGMSAKWSKSATGLRAEAAGKDVALKGDLGMSGITLAGPVIGDGPKGSRFALLSGETKAQDVKDSTDTAPSRLRIYWDSSRSRDAEAAKIEANLVTKIAGDLGKKISGIDLVQFASGAPKIQKLTSAGALARTLENIIYRGGTSLAGLDALTLDDATLCLFVGDGNASVDFQASFDPDCVVHAISAQQSANSARLGRIASRGQLVQISEQSDLDKIAKSLSGGGVNIASVRDGSGRKLPYRLLYNAGGKYALVAQLQGGHTDTSVNVKTSVGARQRFTLADAGVSSSRALGQFWVADRIAAIADDPAANEELEKLSRDYSVASPNMAFVVFEEAEDYVRVKVAPPANFPKKKMAEYREAKKEAASEREDERKDRIEDVLSNWNERVTWWNTRFNPGAGPGKDNKRRRGEGSPPPPAPVAAPPTVAAPPPARTVAPNAVPAAAEAGAVDSDYEGSGYSGGGDEESIMVTARRIEEPISQAVIPVTSINAEDMEGAGTNETVRRPPPPDKGKIEVERVFADRPYLAALDAAKPDARLSVLAAQEKKYGLAPAFYLDTSLWFAVKGDKELAADLLLSALELPDTNAETELIVAYRLLQLKQMDRAVELFNLLHIRADDRPQPARSLALALADRAGRRNDEKARADLERAIELLEKVALEPANDDFDGIDIVALMEANALVPFLEAAGGKTTLDKRFRKLLDLDIRIVIEWTNDDADIDLWVDEPNGERAIYSNPETEIGGKVSNDMTDGFGPEEYVLRRAPKGKFIVRTNSYSPDGINPNGASRIMVRLYRNFGRPGQQMELTDVELSEKDDEENEIVASISNQ